MLALIIRMKMVVLVLVFLFGCKGGGERLFSVDKTDKTSSDSNSFYWSDVEVDIISQVVISSVIKPRVFLVNSKGERFSIEPQNVSWKLSENSGVVFDNDKGTFIFNKQGEVLLSVSYMELESKPINVTVSELKLTDIELISQEEYVEIAHSPNLNRSGGRSFTLMANYNNGLSIDVTEYATWASNNDSVIEVMPLFEGTFLAKAVGTAVITAEYQGRTKSIEVYVYDADITNYPTKCGTEYITIPVPQLRKQLTFKCPPLGKRNGDYNSTQADGFPVSIVNAILPYFSYQSAEAYCNSIGYRLPTWKEHLLLRATINSGPTAPFSFYLIYGWPQLASYWLSGDTGIQGEKYMTAFSAHHYNRMNELNWNKMTALCVKESMLHE